MGTKSPFSSSSQNRNDCSAYVKYKGKEGNCKREGVYEDNDGNYWCGLHFKPGRGQELREGKKDAASVDVNAASSDSKDRAIEEANRALVKISGIKVIGLADESTEKYRAIINEISIIAESAKSKIQRILKSG